MKRAINLVKLLGEVEQVFERRYGHYKGGKSSVAIAYMLPDFDPHWMNNMDRSEGVEIFKATAAEMEKQVASGKPGVADIEGLDDLADELERLFHRKFGVIPALAISFAVPTDHGTVHWVCNVSAMIGVMLLLATAQKMAAQSN